jgi:hypothetical protein
MSACAQHSAAAKRPIRHMLRRHPVVCNFLFFIFKFLFFCSTVLARFAFAA